MLLPVHDLAIRVLGLLRTEWGKPCNQESNFNKGGTLGESSVITSTRKSNTRDHSWALHTMTLPPTMELHPDHTHQLTHEHLVYDDPSSNQPRPHPQTTPNHSPMSISYMMTPSPTMELPPDHTHKPHPPTHSLTHEHLVHDDPHGPVVADIGVASLQEHLRSNIVRSPYCGISLHTQYSLMM